MTKFFPVFASSTLTRTLQYHLKFDANVDLSPLDAFSKADFADLVKPERKVALVIYL